LTEPTPVTVITVSNLIKQFGRFAALRGVTAEFSGGKLYAILGDNGAGKTTLLRTLTGLSQPSSGEVTILGAKIVGTKKFNDICQQVGYMAHPSLLYDEMSGMENLQYFARLYGIADGIASNARCSDVIRAVGLDPDLIRPVGQYSQGMKQRMSLARALLNDPKILLLDEPFSNVDIHSATEMVRLLARTRDEGKTIFVVTHQASLLEKVADDFIWMEYGKIVERTRELKRSDRPATNAGGT
jgi:ABC-type multidrug transport system ATPase subunit